jgi:sterol 3beta-glucosyltransferase
VGRVVILSLGSRGDVEPCIALACALQGEGHEVVILGLDDFQSPIISAGIGFASMSARLPQPHCVPVALDWAMAHAHRHQIIAVEGVQSWLRSIATDVADSIINLVRPSDVIISGILTLDSALDLRSALGCRVAVALFAPCVPTKNGPSLIEALMPNRANAVNRWGGVIPWLIGVRWSRPAGRIVRRRLGLPQQSMIRMLPSTLDVPMLLAASPLLVPPAADWPSTVRLTGDWATSSRPGWRPPSDLLEFLEQGSAALFVGFGSVGHPSDHQLFIDAAQRARVRIVASRPHGSDAETGLVNRDIYVVGETSHAWLFPRMAGIIHHSSEGPSPVRPELLCSTPFATRCRAPGSPSPSTRLRHACGHDESYDRRTRHFGLPETSTIFRQQSRSRIWHHSSNPADAGRGGAVNEPSFLDRRSGRGNVLLDRQGDNQQGVRVAPQNWKRHPEGQRHGWRSANVVEKLNPSR